MKDEDGGEGFDEELFGRGDAGTGDEVREGLWVRERD